MKNDYAYSKGEEYLESLKSKWQQITSENSRIIAQQMVDYCRKFVIPTIDEETDSSVKLLIDSLSFIWHLGFERRYLFVMIENNFLLQLIPVIRRLRLPDQKNMFDAFISQNAQYLKTAGIPEIYIKRIAVFLFAVPEMKDKVYPVACSLEDTVYSNDPSLYESEIRLFPEDKELKEKIALKGMSRCPDMVAKFIATYYKNRPLPTVLLLEKLYAERRTAPACREIVIALLLKHYKHLNKRKYIDLLRQQIDFEEGSDIRHIKSYRSAIDLPLWQSEQKRVMNLRLANKTDILILDGKKKEALDLLLKPWSCSDLKKYSDTFAQIYPQEALCRIRELVDAEGALKKKSDAVRSRALLRAVRDEFPDGSFQAKEIALKALKSKKNKKFSSLFTEFIK